MARPTLPGSSPMTWHRYRAASPPRASALRNIHEGTMSPARLTVLATLTAASGATAPYLVLALFEHALHSRQGPGDANSHWILLLHVHFAREPTRPHWPGDRAPLRADSGAIHGRPTGRDGWRGCSGRSSSGSCRTSRPTRASPRAGIASCRGWLCSASSRPFRSESGSARGSAGAGRSERATSSFAWYRAPASAPPC